MNCRHCKSKMILTIPTALTIKDVPAYTKTLMKRQRDRISDLEKLNQALRDKGADMPQKTYNKAVHSVIKDALMVRGLSEGEAINTISLLTTTGRD